MNVIAPVLSVVIPTYNNRSTLSRCLDSWERFASLASVELIVVEDGCADDTRALLEERSTTPWGRAHLRWVHETNVHELRATNRGFREARGSLLLTWQDDMFLRTSWLVPELLATFARYGDIGLLCLSRGLRCHPVAAPIARWEDLIDDKRLESTIGPRPFNWLRLQEVDVVIRPWVVRRACIDAVGALDEAFAPTEWDEADLCFRIRQGGWKVATHGYERAGAYFHVGSSTVGTLSDGYKQRVLRNGKLFHQRWDAAIAGDTTRERKTWWRQPAPSGWWQSAASAARSLVGRYRSPGAAHHAR